MSRSEQKDLVSEVNEIGALNHSTFSPLVSPALFTQGRQQTESAWRLLISFLLSNRSMILLFLSGFIFFCNSQRRAAILLDSCYLGRAPLPSSLFGIELTSPNGTAGVLRESPYPILNHPCLSMLSRMVSDVTDGFRERRNGNFVLRYHGEGASRSWKANAGRLRCSPMVESFAAMQREPSQPFR